MSSGQGYHPKMTIWFCNSPVVMGRHKIHDKISRKTMYSYSFQKEYVKQGVGVLWASDEEVALLTEGYRWKKSLPYGVYGAVVCQMSYCSNSNLLYSQAKK